MAVSIQGVLYSVGMDTSNFQQGVSTVESLRKKMAADNAKRATQAIKDELAISNAIDNRLKAEKALENAYASGKTRNEIAALEKQVVKFQTAESKAILKGEDNQKKYQAQLKKTQTELTKAEKATQSWGAKLGGINKLVSGLGGALVGAFSARAIYQGFNNIVDSLDKMAKRAKDIGITASAMQEMSHQANLAGVSAEKLDVGLKTLARTGGKDVKTSMIELAVRVEQGTLSVAEAQKYFGENALEMIRILGQGKDAVAKMFDAKGIDEAARAAEMYKDQIEILAQEAMPPLYNAAGKVARTLAYLLDKDRAKTYFTELQDGSDKVTQNFIAQEMGYKNIDDYLNIAVTSEKERLAIIEKQNAEKQKQIAIENAEAEKRFTQLDAEDAKLKAFRDSQKTDEQQLVSTNKELLSLKLELGTLDESSDEYVKIYKEITDKTIKAEQLSLNIAKEKARAQKEQANKAKTQAEQANKAIEAEQKKAQEKAKTQAESRQEFELQRKIDILKATGKKADAEKLENTRKIKEMMDKYGYSIEQATKALKEQKTLEAGSKYSEEDKAKAQKIVDRAKSGRGGSIGKRTLAEAQAIIGDDEVKGGLRTSLFSGAQKTFTPQNVSFDKSALQSKKEDTTAQAVKQAIQPVADALKDIKTSIFQYFSAQTAKVARA